MSTRNAERRTSPRIAGEGRVALMFEDPIPRTVEADLLDTGSQGFRISHDSPRLVPGLEVAVTGPGVAGRARVVWTHLLNGRRVSGFVLL